MKCKNCGLPRDAHIATPGGGGRTIWHCPNGSGDQYPAMLDIKVELHYRAGERPPWVASWVSPTAGDQEVASERPVDALDLAGREIEKSLEEKTAEEKDLQR